MSSSSPQILIVEDSRIHARIIQRCLGETYDLSVETTTEDAVPRLVGGDFALLVVDWGLPGASGLSLVRALRKDPDFQDLPILMQTAKDRAEHVSEALEVGVDDYIVKPIDCESLNKKVQLLL